MGILETMDAKLDLILAKLNASPPIEPPVIIEPPIVIRPIDPPSNGMIEFTDQFYEGVKSNELKLEGGKIYRVNTLQRVDINHDFLIHADSPCTILIGEEFYRPWEGGESGSVFKLIGSIVFHSKNINWCIPSQIKMPQRYIPNLFSSDKDDNSGWTALIENCDTTVMGRNGGMGLGMLYSSLNENHVALINYKHSGGALMDLKVPNPNTVLYLTMENVDTDYLNPDDFNPTYVKTKVRFTPDFSGFELKGNYGSHCAEIEPSLSFHVIANQFYNRGWNNRLNMIHIDRFVFWLPSAQFLMRMVDPILGNSTKWVISDGSSMADIGSKIITNQVARNGDVIDLVRDYWFDEHGNKIPPLEQYGQQPKRQIRSFPNRLLDPISNYPIELQPGDKLKIEGIEYGIVLKERGNNWHIEHEWRNESSEEAQYVYSVLTLNKDLPDGLNSFKAEVIHSSAEYLLDGQFRDAYIGYKGNADIDLKTSTQFGDPTVLYAQAFYHLSYNHAEISLWAKNVSHNGYYRQSSGQGKTIGYNMVNCNGFTNEFNPPVQVTTDKPMPERIKQLIS